MDQKCLCVFICAQLGQHKNAYHNFVIAWRSIKILIQFGYTCKVQVVNWIHSTQPFLTNRYTSLIINILGLKHPYKKKTYSWIQPVEEPLGSPTNKIVLFHILYFFKKETTNYQIILSF